ncbi:hypothetical protein DC366_11750 [Pelagivirga sediminicola]|uniref:Uncharacterized protein n=1 Tax=Pelagivirga sediminicola TaxID=2170575 RepID=A0A2T7G5U5_9RHOB|nr:hypothetical protein DC366_11750 [Pelagivirga sediminicola]
MGVSFQLMLCARRTEGKCHIRAAYPWSAKQISASVRHGHDQDRRADHHSGACKMLCVLPKVWA